MGFSAQKIKFISQFHKSWEIHLRNFVNAIILRFFRSFPKPIAIYEESGATSLFSLKPNFALNTKNQKMLAQYFISKIILLPSVLLAKLIAIYENARATRFLNILL